MIKSVYIHIPFCSNLCNYCDFSKFLLNRDWVLKYLSSLKEEVKERYNNDIIDTLYIGGGTPSSLNIDELNILFDILKIFKLSENIEFTFECNIEDITYDKLLLFKKNKVNRLSIGVQTFNRELLNFLGRKHSSNDIFDKINLCKKLGFNNINIDLIYAIPNQSMKDLKDDINKFLSLDINHLSTYSLIIEPNTKLYINKVSNIDDKIDYEMYKYICDTMRKNGYNHYEISNFAKKGYESKHNLVYWNNLEYYGFGIGASGFINNIRYDNTRSFNNYINKKYINESHILTKKENIENEFILGLRKIKGINKESFKSKYNIDINSIDIVKKLLKEEKLLEDKKNIYINIKYIYTSNDILINFIN